MATKEPTNSQIKTAIKKKPRGGNSPVIGDNGLMLEPGDNSRYLNIGMQLMKLPAIDLHNAEAVEKRLDEFFQIHFENDMKPTVSGMGMALGVDRRRLWEIKTGKFGNTRGLQNLPQGTTEAIKKAYILMENLWENYMQNGRINPVSGIFLGKNNFGYLDKTEYVLTPNQQQDSDYDADEIRKRYLLGSGSSENE
jgi:hypothetical protein